MIWRIARKELTEIVRDGRFRLLAALMLAIAAVSLAAGWSHYTTLRQQHEEAQRDTREQWLNQPAKSPHSAAHYGVYAFKPASRLSLVDTGVDPFVGVAAWLEAHKQNEFKYRPAQDATAMQRFGRLTAAEGLLVLAPLFIVLVAFPVFSGEREQGTLRQLLAIGVPPMRLAAGKALGLSAALALVLLPATLLAVIALSLTATGATAGGTVAGATGLDALLREAPRATLMAIAYLAYFALFLAIAIGVSARVPSSRVGLVILLSFWFANSFLAPRAAADLAGLLHPTPSSVAFHQAMEADLNDGRAMDQRLEARKQALLKMHGETTLEAVPVNFAGISLQEGENHGNEVFDRHFDRLFARYEQQNRTMALAGLAAPAPPMRALSMALAGTDFSHHRRFVTAAEDYRRAIQRTMNDAIAGHAGESYTAGRELWARVPAFAYDQPDAGWALRQTRASAWLLGGWLVAGVLFAVTGAARVRGL